MSVLHIELTQTKWLIESDGDTIECNTIACLGIFLPIFRFLFSLTLNMEYIAFEKRIEAHKCEQQNVTHTMFTATTRDKTWDLSQRE